MKTPEPKYRPPAYFLLAFLVFFQAVSGLFGGGALVLHPDGSALQIRPYPP